MSKEPLDNMRYDDLKQILKARGQKLSGRKSELVERILKHDLDKLTLVQLKDILRPKGEKVSGTKAELVDRILNLQDPVRAAKRKAEEEANPSIKKKRGKADPNDPFLRSCFLCGAQGEHKKRMQDARICASCASDPRKKKTHTI